MKFINFFIQLVRWKISRQTIIVAGLGRCGTSMVYKSLGRYGFYPSPFIMRYSDGMQFKMGHVYKTHQYPPEHLPDYVKVIYLFGNPFNIVISANNKINSWGKLHHRHLGSDRFIENRDLFSQDTMELHEHFRQWYQPQQFSFITIKYESLYEQSTQDKLAEYLGFGLKLPEYQQRGSDWTTHEFKHQLLETYAGLSEKIEKADDVRIWDGEKS